MDVEKREPLCADIISTENNMEEPQKLKIELPYDPAIPLLGIYPKVTKTLTQKDICTPRAALFTTGKTWEQANCP